LLQLFRRVYPRFFLRGLTQAEECREGVDIFAQMAPNTKVFAFQFKAPKAQSAWPDCIPNNSCQTPCQIRMPYRYNIQLDQHGILFSLATIDPNSVFYVFPYYCCPLILWSNCPNLLRNTRFLPLDGMQPQQVFGSYRSRTVVCQNDTAWINPEFHLLHSDELLQHVREGGIDIEGFIRWYREFSTPEAEDHRRSPWLTRGLRIGLAIP